MSYSIEISEKAKDDLRSIFEYIAFTLLAKDTAINQLNRLENGILSLETMPNRHAVYQSEKFSNIRMLPIDNYCVFYIVKDSTVIIIRILYGKRNMNDFV